MVVVKFPSKRVFWIYWTLGFWKKLVHDRHPSTLNFSYQKGDWRGKCWKLVFCVTELWTQHIKKFDHAPNDFVPNVSSVKNTPWNSCIAFLSDSLFNVNMAQHVFLSKKFRKNLKSFCLWGKLFWHGKIKEKCVGKDAYRGCVVTLPPPVLLPVQENFLIKGILLHQGTCPRNVCHSTGGG